MYSRNPSVPGHHGETMNAPAIIAPEKHGGVAGRLSTMITSPDLNHLGFAMLRRARVAVVKAASKGR